MTTAVDLEWAERARNPRLPLWLRVHAYAEAWSGPNGHCPLTPGQLHRGLDDTLHQSQISRAISQAIDARYLHSSSSSRCLVLTRASVPDPTCPASHR